MSNVPQPGLFVLSIDITLAPETTAAATWAVAVAEHLAASRLPATWALDLATNTELAGDLKSADAAHEIAVLADRSWAGYHAERQLVAAELDRRVLGAAAAGQAPTTLVLSDGRVTEHVDLLLKRGITAVRTIAQSRRLDQANGREGWLRRWRGANAATAPVRSLRWGLWEIGRSLDLIGLRYGALARAVDQVASGGGLVHLSFDLAGLTGNVSTGLKLVDRIATQVAHLREQRYIEALTITELVGRLSRPRQNLPARSILRPAA